MWGLIPISVWSGQNLGDVLLVFKLSLKKSQLDIILRKICYQTKRRSGHVFVFKVHFYMDNVHELITIVIIYLIYFGT